MYTYSVVFVPPVPGLKVLPPAPNTQPYPGFQTTVNSGALQAWEQACGQQSALDANGVLTTEYLQGEFSQWFQNYTNHGTDPNEPPPQPPAGAMVQVQPNGIGWDLIQTGPPVCSVPPYVKIPPPGVNHLSGLATITQGVPPATPFSAATPVNKTVTAQDGTVWIRVQ